MAILYALVARGSVVLAEFSATQTNASAIARQILEKIPGTNDSHVSYSQDRYIFHVNRTDGITALCMADDTAGSEFFSIPRQLPLFRIIDRAVAVFVLVSRFGILLSRYDEGEIDDLTA